MLIHLPSCVSSLRNKSFEFLVEGILFEMLGRHLKPLIVFGFFIFLNSISPNHSVLTASDDGPLDHDNCLFARVLFAAGAPRCSSAFWGNGANNDFVYLTVRAGAFCLSALFFCAMGRNSTLCT